MFGRRFNVSTAAAPGLRNPKSAVNSRPETETTPWDTFADSSVASAGNKSRRRTPLSSAGPRFETITESTQLQAATREGGRLDWVTRKLPAVAEGIRVEPLNQ